MRAPLCTIACLINFTFIYILPTFHWPNVLGKHKQSHWVKPPTELSSVKVLKHAHKDDYNDVLLISNHKRTPTLTCRTHPRVIDTCPTIYTRTLTIRPVRRVSPIHFVSLPLNFVIHSCDNLSVATKRDSRTRRHQVIRFSIHLICIH